jgi:hypothetical protein
MESGSWTCTPSRCVQRMFGAKQEVSDAACVFSDVPDHRIHHRD